MSKGDDKQRETTVGKEKGWERVRKEMRWEKNKKVEGNRGKWGKGRGSGGFLMSHITHDSQDCINIVGQEDVQCTFEGDVFVMVCPCCRGSKRMK